MDQKFDSDLQTLLHTLGHAAGKGDALAKFAPPKSQDPLDSTLHEYHVADVAASLFTKRKDLAKAAILEAVSQDALEGLISSAVKQNAGQSATVAQTEHYSAVLMAAKPVEALDKTALRNELIKAGVSISVIDKCYDAATKTRDPAKTLKVTTTLARNGGK